MLSVFKRQTHAKILWDFVSTLLTIPQPSTKNHIKKIFNFTNPDKWTSWHCQMVMCQTRTF